MTPLFLGNSNKIGSKKRYFPSGHGRGTKKNSEFPWEIEPHDLRIPCSDALPLSHREFTVNEVYYEVHVTRVLHTAMISNVFFEYESDFRSNEHYLSSSENKAWKKNSGPYGIWTRDLCDTSIAEVMGS